ncbi:MAG: nucleoside-diphosphate kinase [Syntrophobacterales bacterium]|nr:nucleoside-diphosphate kinase [Syntrophobacterales bacterium]
MAVERTLAIIKPDAVSRGLTGDILRRLEAAGLTIVALKRLRLTREQARAFYAVHRERPFFDSLTDYMSSGPIVALVAEAEDAIRRWRELMGNTDPQEAAPGTIRRDLGLDKEKNAVHGSDGPETAATEIPFFFSALELN